MLLVLVFAAVIVAIPLVVLWSLMRPLNRWRESGESTTSLGMVYLVAGLAFIVGALVLAGLYSWGEGLEGPEGWSIFAAVVVAAGLWAANFALGVFVVREQRRANAKKAAR